MNEVKNATITFTFHYAKIKTYCKKCSKIAFIDLHSTMQRLKLSPYIDTRSIAVIFTFHYAKIKTRHMKEKDRS